MKTIAPLLATIGVVLVCEIDAGKSDKGLCEEFCCKNNSPTHCCSEATTRLLPSQFYEFHCTKQLVKFCASETPSTGMRSRECCRDMDCSANSSAPVKQFNISVNWNEQMFWHEPAPDDERANEWKAKRVKFVLRMMSHWCLNMTESYSQYSVNYSYPVFTRQHNYERKFVCGFYPPAAYLVMKKENHDILAVVSESLEHLWPSVCICVTWTLISGIIIWLLDRRENPVEFPQSFWKGIREGTWWAVVTMTTVGYGDKSPKSLLARIYAAVWMIIGVVILSIFTAEITSALTTRETIPHHSVLNRSIGVPRGSKYHFQKELRGANIIEMNSLKELKDHLKSGDRSHRIVLHTCKAGSDNYSDMQIVKTLEPHIVGVKMKVESQDFPRKAPEDLVKCVREKVGEHFRDDPMQDEDANEREETCDVEMDDYGKIKDFQPDGLSAIIIYASAGLVVVIFIAGSVWDLTRSHDQEKKNEADVEASVSIGFNAAEEPIEICVTKGEENK